MVETARSHGVPPISVVSPICGARVVATAEGRCQADSAPHIEERHIQAGIVAQGLVQYLSVVAPKLVWDSFGSWLRTIRPGIPPSEFVVANALRQTLPDFLFGSSKNGSLAKFIADRQDTKRMRIFRLVA